ncbi:50S ribosomal protein L18e [Aeropyrum camini]|uniref:Large ribosomal subunit protein eL18 n=1 Tax=Aeropyrum camini SY1 = JCM 12091 TaxID=1198449 RepID=U3TGU9_9CREN|nr:50S ribosomal protein L18e [Aeropyrum camini]BAN90564.1 50S ribosomal protein L18 [Aeropyrum camini SY1 = JCM 12091]
MRPTGPTSLVTRRIVSELRRAARRNSAPVWRRVAELLERPRRRRAEVNLSKINRYASDGEMVVVPGKVLGTGSLEKKVTVAALSFSLQALVKIRLSGSRAITLEQAVRENPRGSRTRIII